MTAFEGQGWGASSCEPFGEWLDTQKNLTLSVHDSGAMLRQRWNESLNATFRSNTDAAKIALDYLRALEQPVVID